MKKELIESTFNEQPLSVKHAIILLVNVLKIDYAREFKKIYYDDYSVNILKNRLLERFKKQDPRIILSGYEKAASESPKFMPGVQELIAAIEAVGKEEKRAEINRIEAERVSALPPPTITCDPTKMFIEAKENQKGIPTRAEMDKRIENHRALLIIHGKNIRSIKPNGDQLCKYSMCKNAGTISSSTKGEENFYCAEHWRESA
jgi:hypothetical protein